ncbi:hypothetical protein [Bacillus pumilus]|uniref:hypothetical protein n=1 Tax=Bacillus pumilus TaxID=1408 RepID=UPI00164247E0|nr:hypothetical protein [Bacillus pumilus]
MEEDENLVVYFSLMELRDEVMVDYLKGLKEGKVGGKFWEVWKEIDEDERDVRGMVE